MIDEECTESDCSEPKESKATRTVIAPRGTIRSLYLWRPNVHTFNLDRWLYDQQSEDEDNHSDTEVDTQSPSTNAYGYASSKYGFLPPLHGPRACLVGPFPSQN